MTAPPRDDGPGGRETLAAVLESVPVIGKPLKALLTASERVRSRLALAVAVSVLYPGVVRVRDSCHRPLPAPAGS
jgi:hypothetical protein